MVKVNVNISLCKMKVEVQCINKNEFLLWNEYLKPCLEYSEIELSKWHKLHGAPWLSRRGGLVLEDPD